jgi:hypothetical protein
MQITHVLRPVLLGSALAVSMFAAPTAGATPVPLKSCVVTDAGSTCQSRGNVEITSPRTAITFDPYGTMPFLLGGN